MTLVALNPVPSREPWRLLGEERPLRGEPFSEDHLAEHARALAELLACTTTGRQDHRFLKRFEENAEFLRDSIRAIATGVREGLTLRPDTEWLLDNFYIVEEQLREIQDDLPRRYYRELPKSDFGEPRVYSLAAELVMHTDSVLNEETIVRFVTEFQTVTPLSMGEVWAVPIMLRLVLTENLRRITSQMLSGHASERKATEVVDEWSEGMPFPIDLAPVDEHGSLIFHIVDTLQQDGASNLERLRELEKSLANYDLTIQQSVHLEHQRQASSQVSIGNVITSMRLISAVDWISFFERTSLTEQVLRRDPAGYYGQMDFESRDRYRHIVEDLTDGCERSETEVAETVVTLCQQAAPEDLQSRHVGYWLGERGRRTLEAALNYHPPILSIPSRWLKSRPNLTYLGGLAFLTSAAVIIGGILLVRERVPFTLVLIIAVVAVLPASEIMVALLNTLITSWLRPRLLPKLDFSGGVSPGHRSIVVVPCLLSGSAEVDSLLQRIEMHYLANNDPTLSFALLTDLPDAAQAVRPSDETLVQQAISGIQALNSRHAEGESGPFFLFHRKRSWNAKENVWMGWERKRGKLMEFNHLLRGRTDTSYEIQEGDLQRLLSEEIEERIRYVITLDADTTLPHGAARKMIATMAHPLNAPVFDKDNRKVTSGYVLLQPRVTVNLSSAQNSRFAKVFANNPGLDPYSTCASDVYQDLFGEGSFTGKGIYEIDVFDQALDDAFPENQILSHDLIEGCHTRVGLVSDIELFDNYPAKYEADAQRQHRWVRGDWQISPWLFPLVPSARGLRKNRLSLLSKWKIFDNLRRSLVAPALIAFLVTGWYALPQFAWWFTLAGLLVQAFPMISQLGLALRGWPRNVSFFDQLQVVWKDFRRSALQTILTTAFLPYKAWMMLDAIGRTAVRVFLTHRKLLEWTTASDVDRQLAKKSSTNLAHWLTVPTVTVFLAFLLGPTVLFSASPFLVLWFVSPWLMYWLSLPPRIHHHEPLKTGDLLKLRIQARRIWAFFETYVGARDHWLPPDNIQEYPDEKVAHRISPTNEGLFLVSGLVARDFGYTSLQSLTELWERNLTQWQQFPRQHGHFYNWYDTVTLDSLLPRYVSTVDSGNLVACLLTLQRGIEDLRHSQLLGSFLQDGLTDTIDMIVLAGEQMKLAEDRRIEGPWRQFNSSLDRLRAPDFQISDDPKEWKNCIDRLAVTRADIAGNVEPLAISLHGSNQGILGQIRLLLDWMSTIRDEMIAFYPWIAIIEDGITLSTDSEGKTNCTLKGRADSESAGLACQKLWKFLSAAKSLSAVKELSVATSPIFDELQALVDEAGVPNASNSLATWIKQLREAVTSGAGHAEQLENRLLEISRQTEAMVESMDFRILFNDQRKLFSIGFNLEANRLDGSHYDMLCSEARIASFLAIAKGDVESRHWFHLGRQMTHTAGQLSLLSWGGTMFEYLMPQLFQKTYDDSLLRQSCVAAVARQQEYGRQRSVPWGISECAFGALAANSDYHYRSFGVPGLGLKRGLSKDLVISPYSTLLAVEFDPHGAVTNLDRIQQDGGMGIWGPYEALDYTPERVLANQSSIIVRCYMAHHQGMSLLALGNFLRNGGTRRRFHDHPLVRAAELLLQERTPVSSPKLEPHVDEQAAVSAPRVENEMVSRRIVGVASAVPRVQLLSNGQYHVMVTSTGGGYSQYKELAVTRWRSDATRDHWGQFLYLRDVQSNRVWSATYQPTCVEPTRYEAIYSIDKAEFFRRDGQFDTQLEVAVSPENNAEMRQLRLTNNGRFAREIEITSYAEVSLTEPAADASHMSFQKLFIETEYIADKAALLAKRRPRESHQTPIWAVHALSASPEVIATVQFETSRQKFLGRGRTPQQPLAMESGGKLSGTIGAVLDPVFSLRCRITVPPDESVTVAFTTSTADSREAAIALADQYHDPRGVQRAFELAWAYSQVELRHLQLSPAKMHLYQRLASAMLYPDRGRRPSDKRLQENRLGQRALWRHGISGSVPMFVVYVTKPEQIELVREAIGAHLYWEGRGLKSEFVIVNDYPGSYFDAMQDQLIELLQELQIRLDEKPARVFLLRGAQIPNEDKVLLDAVASIVFHGDRGSFARQAEAGTPPRPAPSTLEKTGMAAQGARQVASIPAAYNSEKLPAPRSHRFETTAIENLEFWNGFGGFAKDGREYHIRLTQDQTTPMPWSNVIANPNFGCLITESGGGYTWFGNSRENKLTTWANDPVTDSPSELLYVFDFDTGETFSPLCGLKRDGHDYWVQHGQGYSRYIHRSNNLSQEALVSIAPDDSIKFIVLNLRNELPQYRRFSIGYFAEWVLGVSREETQMHVVTSIDEKTGALLATNPYHPEMSRQVAFLHVLHGDRSVTGDRTEFLGRNGNSARPAGIRATHLSGHTGAGLDPCGAVQATIRLAPREEVEVVFLLGAADNAAAAGSLLARYGSIAQVHQACEATVARWNETLEAVEVKTPDRALDILVNRWLLYQTLGCRVLGRSAYYQSGGAFGFRDQLQDVMSLVYSRPDLARSHILLAASRQFEEGDVQHWWHPPEGRGTRTRFSDDLLWLPFVVSQYLAVTGDETILEQEVSFLQSPPLEPHQQERYETPSISSQHASLYEHCLRTIERGFRTGAHGIPLMGCGDWNDGMNKVGESGEGESIWVGWFLIAILDGFIPLMNRRGDAERANELQRRKTDLRQAIENNAWDGEWYRRAYFDDGTPLGSSQNDECQIDSIAQTWAVIAGGDSQRSRQAVESVMDRLVQWKAGIVLLFTPPFNDSRLDPGYIKGYVPGIRENGGQYTHSSTWLIQALTLLNDGDRAVQIFDLVNPLNHSMNHDAVCRYQVEPYVVAADVYGVPPHTGRGGWTWYTGSASWLYRSAIEFILGFQLRENTVRFVPKIPKKWDGFDLRLRKGAQSWNFRIVRDPSNSVGSSEGRQNSVLEGVEIPLEGTGTQNEIIIRLREHSEQPRTESNLLQENGSEKSNPPSAPESGVADFDEFLDEVTVHESFQIGRKSDS